MQRTRQQILDCIKLKGPMPVEKLAQELGVVPVTVRAHLAVLEKENMVRGEDVRSGRAGRPTMVYSLTEKAEELFPRHYDDLAAQILNAIKSLRSEKELLHLLRRIGEGKASLVAHRMAGKGLEERVKEIVQIMNQEGCLANWEKRNSNYALESRNCPYLQVSRRFPELCQMELTFLRESLNAAVELAQSIGNGRGTCKFIVHGKESRA